MQVTNKFAFVIFLILMVGSIYYLESQKPPQLDVGDNSDTSITANENKIKSSRYPTAKEISTPNEFINTEELAIRDLIGEKVILVDFWTYSCINCQRTTPYLNAWWDKYKDSGLVIIGVHTPEFEFEEKLENVQQAVKKLKIEYPVVMDNDYSTWNAYKNNYWPRKYLIDIDGYIIYDHIGEGDYEETERRIQQALSERMAKLDQEGKIDKTIVRPEDAAEMEPGKVKSPEVYFGAERNDLFNNGNKGTNGVQDLKLPDTRISNELYLGGKWNFEDDFASNLSKASRIVFKYRAKNVFFVARSAQSNKITVTLDGRPLKNAAGKDISKTEDSSGFVKDDRLYHLVESANYGEHTLEINIEDPGLEAYTFTFG